MNPSLIRLLFLSAAAMTFPALAEPAPGRTQFLEDHCFDCHDGDTKKGQLDLTSLPLDLSNLDAFAMWVKVHDRVQNGEMPPKKKKRPEPQELEPVLSALAKELTTADTVRQQRDGRSGMRRLSRVELEYALRDLLGVPGLRVLPDLPAEGKSHGFDRAAAALAISYVHMDSYLIAVDRAINEATPAFTERPPVFKYRYRPWDSIHHNGRECESVVVQNIGDRNFAPLIGLERDPTFERVEGRPAILDREPFATALGFYRHDDSDYRFSLSAISPVVSGPHKLRVSAYSYHWDGKNAVRTDRGGALGFGIHSTGQHFGTRSVPPNQAGVAEFDVWLERPHEHIHGTDNSLRLIFASCENIRDFHHTKDTLGPPTPCPGVAIEWVEIEGPIFEQWPPASQRALFGDQPVKEWTMEKGTPKPTQQVWQSGKGNTFPKDIYGERGEKRLIVEVVSIEPEKDGRKLLADFLRRAFRRPVSEADVAAYAEIFSARLKRGDHFQDALKAAYRAALTSPDFLMIGARRDQFALATKLSALLWSSVPDDTLLALAEKGALAQPAVLRAQAERMLSDPKGARFVEGFTDQWLRLREIDATQPDKQLYPEFLPWLQESMLHETRAYFAELLKSDLGVAHFVQSDFAMLNEPLARHYGIAGVTGFETRRVALPPGSPRGGFLTQGAVLKLTAAGTTTSPVKRGAFVMEQIVGIEPESPPPGAGSIEPDTRGATTIREQLTQHIRSESCASCHAKMDPYGFALESFDVVGQWRDQYRLRDGKGDSRPFVNGRPINYHYDVAVDCTGQLPDGRPFRDVNDLRAMLAAGDEKLASAFVRHLVTYATGAPVSFADREEVDRIVQSGKASRYGVRTLLLETILNPLFAQP